MRPGDIKRDLSQLLKLAFVSPGLEYAQGFWHLLIPHGLQGGALSHLALGSEDDDEDEEDEDEAMGVDEEGWREEYTDWWFEFLAEKGGKGVSKDTWQMVRPVAPIQVSSC